MTWQDQVNALAASLGIPSGINQAVQSVESGGDPSAVGDQGTSFGLYQLHIGGQAPAGVPTSKLLDPLYNAQVALPHIASGYQAAGIFTDTPAWWTKFAILSGHPGGSPSDSATQAEAFKLQQAYHQQGNTNMANTNTSGANATLAADTPSGNIFSGLSDNIHNAGVAALFVILALVIGFVGIAFMRGH